MSKNINIGNARNAEQKEIMKQIKKDGVCPFCREHFETYHTKPILFETEDWVITENAWPYENAKKHFLLVAKKHVTHPSQLELSAWKNLHECISRLESEYHMAQGTMLMRFGDSRYTGATVDHLHVQLVIAESNDTPIMTRVG